MFTMPPAFNAGDTIYFPFDTYDSNGTSVTVSGLAVTDIEVYKNGSTTQRASDNGYTLLDTDGIDFDGTTGLHGFSIDTSDNSDAGFWIDGAQYWVNVNAVTIDSQTVRFTYFLTLGYLLRPTTAGRKADVSAGGEMGIDWANVGSPTTTVNLSATTIKTATDVETDTVNIQSRIPAALNGGRMDASVGAYQGALAPPSSSANADAVHAYNIAETEFSVGTQGDYTKNKLLRSTVDGRTLDVSAAGNAGIDWGNVEAPTTTVGLTGTTIATVVLVDTLTAYTGNTPQTGDAFARLGAPAGESVSADIADIPTVSEFNARSLPAANYFDAATDQVIVVTNNDKTAYALSDAERSALNAALIVANHLDHLLAAAYDPATEPGHAAALLNVLVENDGGVPRFTANALEQAPAGGGGGGGGGGGLTPGEATQLTAIYDAVQNARPLRVKFRATSDYLGPIVRGDDYDGTLHPRIAIPLTTAEDLTGAAGILTVRRDPSDSIVAELELAEIVTIDAPSGTYEAHFVWLDAAAAEEEIGVYKFDAEITTAGGSSRTWAWGVCEIVEDQSR